MPCRKRRIKKKKKQETESNDEVNHSFFFSFFFFCECGLSSPYFTLLQQTSSVLYTKHTKEKKKSRGSNETSQKHLLRFSQRATTKKKMCRQEPPCSQVFRAARLCGQVSVFFVCVFFLFVCFWWVLSST